MTYEKNLFPFDFKDKNLDFNHLSIIKYKITV